MPRAVAKVKTKTKPRQAAAPGVPQAERKESFRLSPRTVSLALMGVALVYALLAGLHTVLDFDMGWHLATGRYVVQHHVVPSTDILSYTSPGAQWLYPPLAGVLLYGIFSAWGYAGLSWFCSLALMATVACLLRSPSRQESALAAALAILAVPILALRATPRADIFTTLFFAIFLAQLWSFHLGSQGRSTAMPGSPSESGGLLRRESARLWILPPLMLLWVNLHPGFIAGLGILLAYLLIEGLDLFFPERRMAAVQRLRRAWPPLAATVCATLFNPYGLRIFKASLTLAGLQGSNQPGSGPSVLELESMPISFASLAQALELRNPASSVWWLALAAAAVVVLALWRRQFGAALLTAVALYASMQHQRYKALFAIVVVVVGSTILTEALAGRRRGSPEKAAKRFGLSRWLLAVAAGALCLLTCVRIADLISSRSYVVSNATQRFGPGESWWYPERAAAFIQREHLPGNVFQDYNLGGFAAWRLGPAYGDFIDGRNVSPAVWTEQQELLSSPIDSAVWEKESDRRNINILLFSLVGNSAGGSPSLTSLCQSQLWRPIYMDEVSMVLLRNRPENRPWIDRNQVDCRTHNFAPPPQASHQELSNFYANAGNTLLLLGRLGEAKEALEHGVAISPESPGLHFALAQLYEAQQQPGDAEREYEAALSLGTNHEIYSYGLGRFYTSQGRFADARPFVLTATQLSTQPSYEYVLLGNIDLALGQPQRALVDFDAAEEASSVGQGREDLNREFLAQIAEGRAVAYVGSKDWQRAIDFQREAIRRTPENVSRWEALAEICEAAGQKQLAEQARQQARALSK